MTNGTRITLVQFLVEHYQRGRTAMRSKSWVNEMSRYCMRPEASNKSTSPASIGGSAKEMSSHTSP